MTEHRCEKCVRDFASEDALNMHNKSKHPELVKKERTPLPAKKIRNWVVFFIIVGLMVWGMIYLFVNTDFSNDLPANEMNIGSHSNIALHDHADLEIIIDGVEQEIPSDVGVSPGVMRPVHTHDATGEIHIEGPAPRDFTVGDFFLVWDKTFNETCIFEYCTDSGELTFKVNGVENENFNNYVMNDGDDMVIEFVGE